jgi:hypothetical protein
MEVTSDEDSSKPVFDLFGVLRRGYAFSRKAACGNATQVAAIVLLGKARLRVCCHWMEENATRVKGAMHTSAEAMGVGEKVAVDIGSDDEAQDGLLAGSGGHKVVGAGIGGVGNALCVPPASADFSGRIVCAHQSYRGDSHNRLCDSLVIFAHKRPNTEEDLF